jgi:uncharacterized protein YaaQ
MKMILAIVQSGDSQRALEALVTEHFQVTKLCSTGGFLRKGNVTLLIGVEDSQVGDALAVLQRVCPTRENLPVGRGAQSGGAIVFVLNVHRIVKVDAGSN